MSKKIEIGPYSAYAIAVKYGYVGTEEDWIKAVEAARKSAETSAANAKREADGASTSAATATEQAGIATAKAGESAASAEASESSASAAATSEANAKKYSEEAGAKAGTDKTLSIENAPADAKTVGDIILDRAKETPQPIFYSKADVDKLLAGKLSLSGGTLTGPLILADGYNAYGVASNAAAHNAMPPRFKNLGTAATSDIHAAIKAGTFDDIFVGDYFMVGNNPIYIGALDWYLNCGDTSCTEHHALLVPGNNLYTYHMNATNTTEGGYVGSDMYKNGLTQAKQFFNDAFGAAHILTHRQYLVNAVSGGKPTGTDWYDSTVELMNENMVYGGRQFSPMPDGSDPWNTCRNYTIDKGQIPLFQHAPWLICNRNWYWLRDVVSAAAFAYVNAYGYADCTYASNVRGVRPVAGLIG